ncbi:hypothetical protein DSO57_1028731 [Entomophthora muscae]|uniref:Uncharacterized protein n=1 Tax=Entomophthora muscae TaxID=34485 RepID=A0ACC2UNF1_9FUNG|nr:hypothetical protein DSO57_1028731 [Entomophthora muscae]
MDLSSLPTPRRFSILQRNSLVITEISLTLTQYAAQVSSRTMISSLFPSYPSLEKTKSHLLSLLPNLKAPHKDFFQKSTSFFNHSTWYQAKGWRRFCLTSKEVLRRRNNNLCSYYESSDHLLLACPLSKCSLLIKKTSTLTLLSLSSNSKSLTILVTIHGPLGKIKVLALINTGADAILIEE